MITLLAQIQNNLKNPSDIFGKVEVKTGPSMLYTGDVGESIATIFVFGIRFAFVAAGILVLVYMLWGALDYITSGGDPEKAGMARQKILNAFIGIIVLIVVLVLWLFLTNIFGIIQKTENGFKFSLPTLKGSSSSNGSGGNSGGIPPCNNPPPRNPGNPAEPC